MLKTILRRSFCGEAQAYKLFKLKALNEANELEALVRQQPSNSGYLIDYLKKLHDAGQHRKMYVEYLNNAKHLNGSDYYIVKNFVEEQLGTIVTNIDEEPTNKKDSYRGLFILLLLSTVPLSYILYGVFSLLKESDKTEDDTLKKKDDSKTEKKSEKSNNVNVNVLSNSFLSNSPIKPETNLNERFKDVVGIDEFRAELEEIVDYLKNPKKYTSVGATFPKGILLSGPPGTGKTLIARAIAGEANCSFYYKSGSQFDQMFRGSGKDNVKKLFSAAKSTSPAIIFVDEIDSLASNRAKRGSRSNTINQLLTELDGFQKNDSVIFIAATNLEDALDPAIMRSGRIDKVIRIPLPDIGGREKILNYYIEKIKSQKVDMKTMAKRTIGFSGADLKNYVNTAILHAVREDKKEADITDFDYAYDRIHMGVRRKNPLLNKDKRTETAVRHIGQSIASYYTEGSKKFYKVTILPSGNTLGHISLMPTKDELSSSRKNILAQIDVAVAGTAAEEIFFGEDRTTTACSRELEKASNLVYFYVRDMGMANDKLFINAEQDKMSDAYKYKTDQLVQSILHESLDRTKRLIMSKRRETETLVKYLIEKETLTYEEFETILKKGKL